LLALGEEAMSERKVSSGLRDDEKRHPPDHRLGPSQPCGGPRLVANLEFSTVPQNASNKLNRVQYSSAEIACQTSLSFSLAVFMAATSLPLSASFTSLRAD